MCWKFFYWSFSSLRYWESPVFYFNYLHGYNSIHGSWITCLDQYQAIFGRSYKNIYMVTCDDFICLIKSRRIIEADQSQSNDLASLKKFIKEWNDAVNIFKLREKKLPHWLQILQIFDLCIKFKLINWPSVTEIFLKGLLRKEKVALYHLAISQATSLEHFDR